MMSQVTYPQPLRKWEGALLCDGSPRLREGGALAPVYTCAYNRF